MNSVLTRLLKYTSRDGHSPVENFLTECLYCFLERLSAVDRTSLERFIVEVLCGSEVPLALRGRISGARSLTWTTQQAIFCDGERGYLDLCLTADSDIILVVENKIGAAFTAHQISSNPDGTNGDSKRAACDQLTFYENYLRSKTKAATCLVLLTHMREAPKGFLRARGREDPDGAVSRRVCRWAEVHRWLVQWRLSHPMQDSDSAFLTTMAQELSKFLEDHEMDISELNCNDLNVMKAFYAQDVPRKMRALLVSVRSSILALPALVTPYGGASTIFDTTNQIVWDWTYCFEEDLKWFVCWGIAGAGRYGPMSYDIEFDEPLQAFVVIGTDDREIPVPHERLESLERSGWRTHELPVSRNLRLVKSVPPSVLFELDENLNRAFEGWTSRTVEEALTILQTAHENVTMS
jgi:hypothetical protein